MGFLFSKPDKKTALINEKKFLIEKKLFFQNVCVQTFNVPNMNGYKTYAFINPKDSTNVYCCYLGDDKTHSKIIEINIIKSQSKFSLELFGLSSDNHHASIPDVKELWNENMDFDIDFDRCLYTDCAIENIKNEVCVEFQSCGMCGFFSRLKPFVEDYTISEATLKELDEQIKQCDDKE